MSDFQQSISEYGFEEEVDLEDLKDLAVKSGLKFDDTVAGNRYSTDNFHENQNTQTTGEFLPHHRTRYELERSPRILSDQYQGKLDARGVTEYIVEDEETMKISVETAVINRQGRAAEEIHRNISNTAEFSLIDEKDELNLGGEFL